MQPQVKRRYVVGLELVAQQRNTGTAGVPVWETDYYGYDGPASVRYLTDGTPGSSTFGQVTDTYTYDAFGVLLQQTPATGGTPNHYRYAGEQWDADLGLYYNRARYLNAHTGRFWSMDRFEGRLTEPLFRLAGITDRTGQRGILY